MGRFYLLGLLLNMAVLLVRPQQSFFSYVDLVLLILFLPILKLKEQVSFFSVADTETV